MYVDVILPVPVEGFFTYSIPDTLAGKVAFGMRVLVPFGRSKNYTAVAIRIHDEKPEFEVKDILSVLDDTPMLLPQQFRLWQWIADYYLCPIGDIYKAAMPQGLKAEDGYKPRMETYIKLADFLHTEQSLQIAKSMLTRALQQNKAFDAFLQLSSQGEEITREELMNMSKCTSATVKALIDRKFIVEYKKEVGRLNDGDHIATETEHPLNDKQQNAFNQIKFQFMKKNVVLLHGVTSSGKTEIYIHLIRQAILEHKQVLYLLPEIALTVQITDRLRRVFGNKLGIYHSKYSDAERVEIWKKQMSNNPYDMILGARSSVFLPFQNLGLIIIDEEHETSFKQQEPAPRYHARSAAIVLAQMYGAKTLLGTATPSVESYFNARTDKYGFVELTERYKGLQLPEINVVDVKDLRHRKIMSGPFSPQLLAGIREALENGEQVILFQNRRGFAPMIECKECGWVPKCTNCDVSLTYHKNTNTLTCHYCGFTYKVPEKCPNCGSLKIQGRGYGTEKIEDQIHEIFPEAKIARMDLDTTHTRNAYERIIGDFSHGKTNILVGTQMVTKGLDFDKVSLVGILDADTMLNYPDFRAYEHAFMMMAQVSGRAGRKGKRGTVMLQTRSPEMPVIQQVVSNDYKAFFDSVLDERKAFCYPPFYHLIYVFLKHSKEPVVDTAATEFASRLRKWFGDRVLGPDKPSVARVKTLNIRKIMIKLENGINQRSARQYLRQEQQGMLQDKRYAAVQIYYDVDPL